MSLPDGRIPADAVVGYVVLSVETDGAVRAAASGRGVGPGRNEATHDDECNSKRPGAGCRCGFDAFASVERAVESAGGRPGMVVVAVAGWGLVDSTRESWRARFVQAVAIAEPDRRQDGEDSEVERLAARWLGVRLVATGEIDAAAGDVMSRSTGPAERSRARSRRWLRALALVGAVAAAALAVALYVFAVTGPHPFMAFVAPAALAAAVGLVFGNKPVSPIDAFVFMIFSLWLSLGVMLIATTLEDKERQRKVDGVADRVVQIERDALRSGRGPVVSVSDLVDAHPDVARLTDDADAEIVLDVSTGRGEVVVKVRGPKDIETTRRLAFER